MSADVAVGHAARRQGQDDVLDRPQPALPLRDDRWFERSGTVSGDADGDRAGLRQHRLRPGAVAGVAVRRGALGVFVVAEVVGDLAFQRGLQHQSGQLGQQAALPVDRQALALRVTHELGDQPPVHHRRPSRLRHHSHSGSLHHSRWGRLNLPAHRVPP